MLRRGLKLRRRLRLRLRLRRGLRLGLKLRLRLRLRLGLRPRLRRMLSLKLGLRLMLRYVNRLRLTKHRSEFSLHVSLMCRCSLFRGAVSSRAQEASKTAPRRRKRFPDDLTNTPKTSKTAQEGYQGGQDIPKCLHTVQYGSQTPKMPHDNPRWPLERYNNPE